MCEGTGEKRLSVQLPRLLPERLHRWVHERLPHTGLLTAPCGHCEATGEVEETREKHLHELTNTQLSFLLEAEMFRENGGEDQEENPGRHQQPVRGHQPHGHQPPAAGRGPSRPPATGRRH